MDQKQAFIQRVQSLNIPSSAKEAVLAYVSTRDFSDQLVEEVASMLERIADEVDVAADQASQAIDIAENLRDELKEKSDAYLDQLEDADFEYQDELSASLDGVANEIKPESPSPVQETPATSQPVMEVAAPVVNEPVMETVAPVTETTQPSMEMPTPIAPDSSQNMGEGQPVVSQEPVMPWQQNPAGNPQTQQ